VQFEAAGPGVQGNPAGLEKVTPFAFQVYTIEQQRYLDVDDFLGFCSAHDIPTVEIIESPQQLPDTHDALVAFAEGMYGNGWPREGVVIRPVIEQRMPLTGDRLSFKVINVRYRD
jgi:ATP-dependent RNA circularization protein (DNA/RNA ligase family)